MSVTFTSNLGLTKPDLDQRNWHLDLNGTIDLLEQAISGVFTKAITGSDDLDIDNGLTSEGRNALVEFTGEVTPPAIITVPNVEKIWLFLNSTDQSLTIDNGSGDTVTLAVAAYSLVYNDGTDVKKIFEIPANSPELGIVATLLSDKSFKEQFDFFDTSLWTQFQALAGTTAVVTGDDAGNRKSVYGGNFLRLEQRAGYYFKPLPFNEDALYKVSCRIRQHSDGGSGHQIFIGFIGVAADGFTVVDINGGSSPDPTLNHMVAKAAFSLDSTVPGDWFYFEGYVKGTAATGSIGPNNDANAPGVMHEDVRYIAPAFVVNWESADPATVCDIDSVELEIVEPRNQINGNLGFSETGKADATDMAMFIAGFGLQARSFTMTGNLTLKDDLIDELPDSVIVQYLDPDGTNRNVNLPISLTQRKSFFIINDSTGGNWIRVRADEDSGEEVNVLRAGEWMWITARNLTPTTKEDWLCLAKSTQVINFTADASWIVPQGVTTFITEMCGGGGGGAQGNSSHGGGGGAGAAHREGQIGTVTPGETITISIGQGGAGGAGDGTDGTNSNFSPTSGTAQALGGKAGARTSGAGGEAGGSGFLDSGGNGGNGGGVVTNNGVGGNGTYGLGSKLQSDARGGGGGGSNGFGGNGGAEGNNDGSDATDSRGGGGGGGGGRDVGGGGGEGGNGANGFIQIRF